MTSTLHARHVWVFAGLFLFLSACDSGLVNDPGAVPDEARSWSSGDDFRKTDRFSFERLSEEQAAPYVCHVSVKEADGPDGYRHDRLRVVVPETVAAPSLGARTHARYRFHAADGTPLWTALCVVPDAPLAIEMLWASLHPVVASDLRVDEVQPSDPERAQGFCRPGGVCLSEIARPTSVGGSAYFEDRTIDAKAPVRTSGDVSTNEHCPIPDPLPPVDDTPTPPPPPDDGSGDDGDDGGSEDPPDDGGYYPVSALPKALDPTLLCGSGGGGGGGGENPDPPNCVDCPCVPSEYNACSPDDGGDEGDGDTGGPSPAEQLATALEQNPFLLLDIPCDQIPAWQDVANLVIPQEVLDGVDGLDPFGISEIQDLRDAWGGVVNMDYFAVSMDVQDIPNGMTPEQFLVEIRSNLNGYTDVDGVNWTEVVGSMSDPNPLGAVVSISLAGGGWIEEGSVIVSEHSPSRWTFSTVYTTFDGAHPVSGNRRFGFVQQGSHVTFFTRGIDRMTGLLDRVANTGGFAFDQADALWQSFQQQIVRAVESSGGSATALDPITYRPDWNEVEDVITGAAPISSIDGCDT